jgi:sugar lactone lactonase YvrE
MRHDARRRWMTLAAVAALSACVSAPEPPPAPARVWPSSPEAARIQYVRSFSTAGDLGIRKGFLRRLVEWVIGADGEERLIRPVSVLVAPAGTIYVGDPGVKGVHRFDRAGGAHTVIRRAGDEPLPSPVGLALCGEELIVADSALGGLFAVAPNAEHAQPLALGDALRQPTGVSCDRAGGRLTVVDTGAHQVKVYARDGRLLETHGRRGAADGEFNYPTLLWRDAGGGLWVTDSLNFRVQRFDAGGRYLGKFGRLGNATGDLSRPKGVATDRAGHVYVVDSLFHAFQVFDATGRLLLNVGQQGSEPGEFWLPTGIFVGADDAIYIADSHNRRVQVFRYLGGAT